VIRTRVGYAGGTTKSPTYRNLGDHTETVEIDFDPTILSYQELLSYYFAAHEPFGAAFSRQYASIIFPHDAEQEQAAREAKAALEARTGRSVGTEIVMEWEFYRAEDYHQKYALQNNRALMREFELMYPDFADIVDSTAAARVNGFLYGCGSPAEVQALQDDLGLSPEAVARLVKGLGG